MRHCYRMVRRRTKLVLHKGKIEVIEENVWELYILVYNIVQHIGCGTFPTYSPLLIIFYVEVW